jgi:hypothetical protein
MNPKRILLILAGLLAFAVGLVSALRARDLPTEFGSTSPGCHVTQSGNAARDNAIP